jgi:hypothetical protein
MNVDQVAVATITNNVAGLSVDPFGGAITRFELAGSGINPLGFHFTSEQMPANNKGGANFQGHFICLGRWGLPSAGEINSGIPNHGEPANSRWTITGERSLELRMQTLAGKEGLAVERLLLLDAENAVYLVKESVKNINPLGRLYNMVQHPSFADPFLDETTIVDCNAAQGFDQAHYKAIPANKFEWPGFLEGHKTPLNLRTATSGYSAVYSFVSNPSGKHGWITAYSPKHHLLLGYCWKRSDYPWIHIWQQFEEGKLLYLGTEFGTAGIHQPFKEILDTATTLFGEKTFDYLDSGETVNRAFISFTARTSDGFSGVEGIELEGDRLFVKAMPGGEDLHFRLSKKLTDEFSG